MSASRFSISTRITLINSLAFLLIMVGISWFTLASVRLFLDREARDSLALSRETIVSLQEDFFDDPAEALQELSISPHQQISVYNDHGRRLFSRNAIFDIPALESNGVFELRSVPLLESRIDFEGDAPDSARVWLLQQNVTGADGTGFVVQFIQDMSTTDRFLQVLLSMLLLANGAGITIAFLFSLAMSRRILKPVDRLIGVARGISAQDLSRRVPENGPDDELTRLAHAFNEMLERLQRSFQRQSQFVSDASHELRTPLATLHGHSTMLLRWGLKDPAVLDESLTTMKSETERMQTLVERLLFLARSDSGASHLTRSTFDLSSSVDEIVRQARLRTPDRTFRYTGDPGVSISADQPALRRAIENIIDNAVRYSRQDGEIAVDLTSSAGNAVISVDDQGPFIEPYVLERIFDRFYRADDSRSRRIEGTGLGLSISRDIVELHGGHLVGEIVPDRGNRFSITIPIQPEDENT
jgi:two-component system sensor histidine kinase ArlS